jgi:DNA polymerase-3 subunit epsilon
MSVSESPFTRFLARWFTPRELAPELARRLADWRRLPEPGLGAVPRRWVVIDTETSGLDSARGRLISIGAVAIEDRTIIVEPVFDAVLRQAQASSRANIELHGIGAGAQAQGEDPALVLIRFLEFARKDPLVAWHAGFDAAFLRRALKAQLGLRFGGEWLDVALLAPLTLSANRADRVLALANRPSLDAWLDRFDIDPGARHDALCDAYATAQLFQIAARRITGEGRRRLRDFLDMAGEHVAVRQGQGGY